MSSPAERLPRHAATTQLTPTRLFNEASAQRAAGDLPEAARLYESAIRADPHLSEAYLNVAWVFSELGRAAEAQHAYRHGLRQRQWPAETEAAAQHNLGVLLRDSGRDTEAAAAFKAALAAKPDFGPTLEDGWSPVPGKGGVSGSSPAPAALTGMQAAATFVRLINEANELYAANAHGQAAELYQRAIPLRDARVDGSAYVGLGAALHGGGRLAEAKHVLVAGARLNPLAPSMLANLATVRTDLGHGKAECPVKLQPPSWPQSLDYPGIQARVWTLARRSSLTLTAPRPGKAAAAAWKRALALTPNDAASYRSAASALTRLGRLDDALLAYGHTAKLDPTNWQHHYSRAHVAFQLAHVQATPRARKLAAGGADAALAALRPLHRRPISLTMRADERAEPPWTRGGGRTNPKLINPRVDAPRARATPSSPAP